jgi:HK97 gp10 family phage protein
MAGDVIRISGLDDAKRALEELPRKLRFGALRKALRAAGNVIKREAQANAPVLQTATKHRIRGLVRRSLTVRSSRLARRRGDLGVYVTVRRLTGKQITAGKAAGYAVGRNPRDPFYFRFLETGTQKMAARSFIGPALQAKGEEASQAFSDELRRAIVAANSRL